MLPRREYKTLRFTSGYYNESIADSSNLFVSMAELERALSELGDEGWRYVDGDMSGTPNAWVVMERQISK